MFAPAPRPFSGSAPTREFRGRIQVRLYGYLAAIVCVLVVEGLNLSVGLAQVPPSPQPQNPAPEGAPVQMQLAPSNEPSPDPNPPQTPQASRPGLIDAIGDLMKDSADRISNGFKDTQKSIEDLNQKVGETNRDNVKAAKDAVDGLSRLPGTHLVTGHVLCGMAANGSPDCKSGSDSLCKEKGFGEGKSLATETAQKCPARVYLSGRAPKEGDCRLETYVTQALCQ